jgi:epoxyqueuosine reductase QueG
MYEKIKRLANQLQVQHTGVADLSLAKEAVREQGGEFAAKFPYCVSLGIVLPHAIVDMLPQREQRAVQISYRSHAYDVINDRLNDAASRVASLIQANGYSAMPISSTAHISDENLSALFSHKLGAHLAGLGWIGKSCLLVTKENGPRVRFVSVLTDAPLTPTGAPMEQRCGDCMECVNICPVHAFTGRNFKAGEPREARYDAHKCNAYFNSLEAQGKLTVCGMCLFACPHGRRFH